MRAGWAFYKRPAMSAPNGRMRSGLLFGLGAYLLWGIFPLYFKAIGHVGPIEIVGGSIQQLARAVMRLWPETTIATRFAEELGPPER